MEKKDEHAQPKSKFAGFFQKVWYDIISLIIGTEHAYLNKI